MNNLLDVSIFGCYAICMELVDEAKKKFGKFDLIINVFTMQIVWASKKACEKLGYDSNEIIGLSMRKIFPFNYKAITNILILALKEKVKDSQDVVRKDGSKIKIEAILQSFTYDKEPYVVTTFL